MARPASGVIARVGDVVAGALASSWLVGLAMILRHRIFISLDTLINYAHVWYISDAIWHGHRIPFRMPVLGHGQAFAFPYGLVPWLTASLFRPLAGDWIVTLWVVVGALAAVAATFFAFPELVGSWWSAAVLANPALISAAVIGQVPFLWGAALLLAAAGCWRRQRRGLATVLAALAQITHPAVVAPIAAGMVLAGLRSEPDRKSLLRCYALSLLPAMPAAALVARSPVFAESSIGLRLTAFVETLLPRALVVVVPAVLAFVRRMGRAWMGVASLAALVALNAVLWMPLNMPSAWRAFGRRPNTTMLTFTRSAGFVPGATYRVLEQGDNKLGMYQLIRAGGRLDSEFFPESIVRRSWPNEEEYSAFLRQRDVDYVMIWWSYTAIYHVNEFDVLDGLERRSAAGCAGPLVCVRRVSATDDYTVFAISRGG